MGLRCASLPRPGVLPGCPGMDGPEPRERSCGRRGGGGGGRAMLVRRPGHCGPGCHLFRWRRADLLLSGPSGRKHGRSGPSSSGGRAAPGREGRGGGPPAGLPRRRRTGYRVGPGRSPYRLRSQLPLQLLHDPGAPARLRRRPGGGYGSAAPSRSIPPCLSARWQSASWLPSTRLGSSPPDASTPKSVRRWKGSTLSPVLF